MPAKLEAYLKLDTGTHSAFIRFLIPVPNSPLLISGGADKTIRVWDLESRREVKKILGQIAPGQAGELEAAQITPDGRYLIVTVRWSPDGTEREETLLSNLRIYDLSTGNLERALNYSSYITDMCLSPDGEYVVLCSHVQLEMEVYRLKDLRLASEPHSVTVTLPAHTQPRRLAINQVDDLYTIVCGVWGEGGLLYYHFNGSDLVLVNAIPLENGQMAHSLAMSDRYVAMSGNVLPEVMIFDMAGKLVKRLADRVLPTDALPGDVAFSRDGSLLVVGNRREAVPTLVQVFSATKNFALVSRYAGHDIRPEAVAFLANDDVVSACGSDNAIHVWDCHEREGRKKFEFAAQGQVVFGVGLRDDRYIGFGNTSDLITDPDDIAPLERVFDLEDFSVATMTATEAADYARATQVYKNRHLQMDGDQLWLEPEHLLLTNAKDSWYQVNTCGFTPKGTIIIGDSDGNVRVGKRSANGKYAPRPWQILGAHTSALLDHAADSQWLVTAGVDQVIRLWHLPDVEEGDLTKVTPALNLFVSKEDEWVLWSESGFYCASEKGDMCIGYHVNQGEGQEALFYTCDRFIKQLYRPDIIRSIVATGSEARALRKLGLRRPNIVDMLPPVIEAIGPGLRVNADMQADLNFEVRRAGEPVDRVWVLLNDKFAWEDRSKKKNKDGEYRVRLPLTLGTHRVKILAHSASAKSNPLQVTLVATSARMAEEVPLGIAFGEAIRAQAPEVPPVWLGSLTLSGMVNTAAPSAPLRMRRNGETIWKSADPGEFDVVIPLGDGDSDIIVQSGQDDAAPPIATIHVSRPHQIMPVLSLDTGSSRGEDSPVVDQLTEIPPNLYIMAVGVSTLLHPEAERGFNHLKYAHLDAQEIISAFQTQKGKLYGDVFARLLMNEEATRDRIMSELDALWQVINARAEEKASKKQRSTDVTLLFLSGHGLDYSNDFYFWNYDLSLANPSETGVRMLDLGDRITSVPTELIVMTDACRAGMIGSDLIRAIDPLELAKRLIAINERAQFIISSSRKDTKSWEHDSLKHGIFTKSALEGLTSAPMDVTLLWLTDFVQRKVAQRTGGKQVPVAKAYGDMMGLLIYKK